MKKILAVLLAAAVITGFSAYKLLSANSKDKSEIVLYGDSPVEDVIDKYAALINKLKNTPDFSVAVTTNLKTTDVESSVSIFSAVLSNVIDVDESSSEIYTFVNGVSKENGEATPNSVIPPGASFVEITDYSAVVSTAVEDTASGSELTLVIAEENTGIADVIKNNNFSGVKLPEHEQFVTAGDMLSALSVLFGGDEDGALPFNQDPSQFGFGAVEFDLGNCSATVGATTVRAVVSGDSVLRGITIEMPLTIHMNVEIMSKHVTVDIYVMIAKQYEIDYS